jgi:TolB-like protein/tetratricopeptide (TPR) repeat protein
LVQELKLPEFAWETGMPSSQCRFGRFRINPEARVLTFEGRPVHLNTRAFDILSTLAAAKGALVTKDELISQVWRGLIVEENNIQVHVSALRKALDGCEAGQNYIVTVSGRGYRLAGLDDPEGGDTAAQVEMSRAPAIAVLPFLNMSGDTSDDYFADGLTEEIISGLSRIRWLQVTARNSTFRLKGRTTESIRASRDLDVRYLLEGSVRKAGGRVRVNAHLVRAIDGVQIWTERYDRPAGDIFDVQDDVMASVIGAIEPNLRKAEIELVRRKRPENLDAYDCVLQALPFVYGMMADGAARAMPLLRRALELDPSYAAAHAGLAWCHHFRYSRGGLGEEDRAASIQHAHAALTFGSDDATTLAIAALVIWFDEHDEATAFNLFDRALGISRSNVFALFNSAVALAWSGRFEVAVERGLRALELSPFDPLRYLAYNAFAIVHFSSGRFPESRDAANRGIEANPGFSVPHAYLAAALVRMARMDEAKRAASNVLQRDPGFRIAGFRQTVGINPTVFEPYAAAWRQAGLPD